MYYPARSGVWDLYTPVLVYLWILLSYCLRAPFVTRGWVCPFVMIYRANRHLNCYTAPSSIACTLRDTLTTLMLSPHFPSCWHTDAATCELLVIRKLQSDTDILFPEEVTSGLGQCPVSMRVIKCQLFFPLPEMGVKLADVFSILLFSYFFSRFAVSNWSGH
jgi:hypothetical protein